MLAELHFVYFHIDIDVVLGGTVTRFCILRVIVQDPKSMI